MNVTAVRNKMADVLSVIPGQINSHVLSQPTPPGMQIIPPGVTYDYSFGTNGQGLNEWAFILQGYVALNSDVGAQLQLDDMCADEGSLSVKLLLEADKTLGGLVDTLRVVDQSAARQVEQPPGNPMLLVEWHVMVWAKGA